MHDGDVIPFKAWEELNPSYIELLKGVTVLAAAGDKQTLPWELDTGVIAVLGVPTPVPKESVLVACDEAEERWVNEDGIIEWWDKLWVFEKEGERQEVVVRDEDEFEIDEIDDENDEEPGVERVVFGV